MPKSKGHKMDYADRWRKDLLHRVPTAMSGPAGNRLRQLRDEIRREHNLNRKGDPECQQPTQP